MARHKMKRSKSRRVFRKTSGNTRAINLTPTVMRGGYRL